MNRYSEIQAINNKQFKFNLMNNTQELGGLKSTHAPSKAFLYFSIFIFLIFSGISAFIFSAIRSVEQKKINFSGDISLLYWCIATESKWEVITIRHRKVLEAINFTTTQHQKIHVPAMLKKLQQGGSVTGENKDAHLKCCLDEHP